jgi:hypothetical protein
MNIGPEYKAVDLITGLLANLANSLRMITENYHADSEEFTILMNAIERPTRILHELVKSQGFTKQHSKNSGLLKANRELGEELNNRLMASSVVQKTNKTTNRHLRLV